jgi:hypothetical protein
MATTLDDIRRHLQRWEKGVYSRGELLTHLVSAAADCRPGDLIELIAEQWVEAIRDATRVLPNTADDVIIMHLGCFVAGADNDAGSRDTMERKQWFDGATRWHHFLASQRSENECASS